MKSDTKKTQPFALASDLFAAYQLQDKGGYITQEFQDFGYRLAVELDDLKHKSLYIKMAKEEKREILEKRLNRSPSWVEVIVEYKGLGPQLQTGGQKANKVMEIFNEIYKKYQC